MQGLRASGDPTRIFRRSVRGTAVAAYLLINFLFLLAVIALSLIAEEPGRNPAIYLMLLVAVLSAPLLIVEEWTGPTAVLLIAAPVFFVSFGLGDVVAYFHSDEAIRVRRSGPVLTDAELAILIGFLALYSGFAVAVTGLKGRSDRWFIYDWDMRVIFWLGLAFFAAGMIATIVVQTYFNVLDMGSVKKLGSVAMNTLILGRMLGSLGEVLLSYAAARSRSKTVAIVVMLLVAAKLPFGIILNSKEIGLSFLATYILTVWLVRGAIPKKEMAVGFIVAALFFPLAYQYRAYMGEHNVSVAKTLDDVGGHFGKALEGRSTESEGRGIADRLLEGVESFSGRTNLKPTIELITARAGTDLPYQHGYTLTPLLYVLVPRFLYPGKPDVPVGQLFNKEFGISPSPDTWISVTFLGELYWNYSWFGLVLGMCLVGFSYGVVGSVGQLRRHMSVSRVLVVITALYTLVVKFESGIAQQYSLFLRGIIIIVLLHYMFRQSRIHGGADEPAK